jgi:hypothetical protein
MLLPVKLANLSTHGLSGTVQLNVDAANNQCGYDTRQYQHRQIFQ